MAIIITALFVCAFVYVIKEHLMNSAEDDADYK